MTRSVILRVITFYVGSMFLIVMHRAVERQQGRRTRRSSPRSDQIGIPAPPTS